MCGVISMLPCVHVAIIDQASGHTHTHTHTNSHISAPAFFGGGGGNMIYRIDTTALIVV